MKERTYTMAQAVRRLARAGIELCPDGGFFLAAKDAELFLADPDGWRAARYDMSRDDYLAWSANSELQCSATTKQGGQCKKRVNCYSSAEYVRLRLGGWCCAAHRPAAPPLNHP